MLSSGQSLSNPQKPGGSDTPQLCSIVPGKQKRTTFCVVVTVTWDRLQLLSAPSSGSRVLDLPGLCLNPANHLNHPSSPTPEHTLSLTA